MNLIFLGTSGVNAFPEAFCSCPNCQQARAVGGPSLRKRSSVLINDDLLIDLGPDVMASAQLHNTPLTGVQFCLQTHPHADHLDVSHILSRSPLLGVSGAPCLHFFASDETLAFAAETFKRDLPSEDLFEPQTQQVLNLQLHPVTRLQPFFVGAYRVIAFPANHAAGMGALLYAVEMQGRCLLYATDTGPLPEDTWQSFQQAGLRFDVVILDHTFGVVNPPPTDGHLNAGQFAEHVARLRRDGLLKDGGRVFATHLSHSSNPTHAELVQLGASRGYEIAYDGLMITV